MEVVVLSASEGYWVSDLNHITDILRTVIGIWRVNSEQRNIPIHWTAS